MHLSEYKGQIPGEGLKSTFSLCLHITAVYFASATVYCNDSHPTRWVVKLCELWCSTSCSQKVYSVSRVLNSYKIHSTTAFLAHSLITHMRVFMLTVPLYWYSESNLIKLRARKTRPHVGIFQFWAIILFVKSNTFLTIRWTNHSDTIFFKDLWWFEC